MEIGYKGGIMFLKSIHIWNYRLLLDIDICLDKELTLFVGKNNSGKTSIINIVENVLSGKRLRFDDYPISCRKELYELLWKYTKDKITLDKLEEDVPTTKIRFKIDYSEEEENESLGALSPFIIDLDVDNNIACIETEYRFSISDGNLIELKNKLADLKITNNNDKDYRKSQEINIISNFLSTKFDSLFPIVIKAINPSNESVFQVNEISQLKELFIFKKISAERNLDESDIHSKKPIGQVMERIFESDLSVFETDIQKSIDEFKTVVEKESENAQKQVNDLLSNIVDSMIKFGYPTAEDMQLKAKTQITLKDDIIKDTDLTYTVNGESESLPSSHNGLGYKNLIKIIFLLKEFSQELKQCPSSSIPLLFLEEPEAHMHPQLQTVFVQYINTMLKELSGNCIQTIISSHSPHIANSVPFKQVRYLKRFAESVICKNLSDFYNPSSTDETKKENLTFLHKYMTISRCDLYFCDKLILVEGAAERLLIPDMIKKCDANGEFNGTKPTLTSQYCSIIEVGGAYAHRFFDLIDFLGIPTLILTDIDFVSVKGKRCLKEKATRTSNAVIIKWCHDKLNISLSKKIKIQDVYQLTSEELLTNGCRHIEFQKEQNNYHPRSLEEAIMNVNRDLYGIPETDTNFKFDTKNNKKTDFALTLLMNPKFEKYNIPSYILDGLKWLNKQSKMAKNIKITFKEKRKTSLTEKILYE